MKFTEKEDDQLLDEDPSWREWAERSTVFDNNCPCYQCCNIGSNNDASTAFRYYIAARRGWPFDPKWVTETSGKHRAAILGAICMRAYDK